MKKTDGARKVAFGGILAAIAVVLLLLAGILPHGRFILPMAAGLAVFIAAREFSDGLGVMLYAAISLLSLFVCADKTGVLCFVLVFGYYPLIKRKIEYISHGFILWGLKFLLFTAVFIVFILANRFIFGVDLTAISFLGTDLSNYSFLGMDLSRPFILGIFIYVVFLIFIFIYDYFLTKFYPFYDFRIRPHIFHRNK